MIPALPEGTNLRRLPDGTVVLELPVSQDQLLPILLGFIGMIFLGVSVVLVAWQSQLVGIIPGIFGALFLFFAAYFALGKLEIRCSESRLVWSRIFLRRWKSEELPKSRIGGMDSLVTVRTNGRPTGWTLKFQLLKEESQAIQDSCVLPGSFNEKTLVWLGKNLADWSGKNFDSTLDRLADLSE